MVRKSNAPKIKEDYGEKHFAEIGAKGGQAKVLKGIHKIRIEDPERYRQIQLQMQETRRRTYEHKRNNQ